MTDAAKSPPVCCYCDHDLSCGHCGMEQPYNDISVLKARIKELEAAASAPSQAIVAGGVRAELERCKSNHKSVVESKRRTELRLKASLAALQQIYTVCNDNAGENCDQRMTVNFIRDVACNAFEKATTRVISDEELSALPAPEPQRGTDRLCSCRASDRDGQHMMWCPAIEPSEGE
jgi:hypothetical protein